MEAEESDTWRQERATHKGVWQSLHFTLLRPVFCHERVILCRVHRTAVIKSNQTARLQDAQFVLAERRAV